MNLLYNIISAAAENAGKHEEIPINVSEGLIVFFLGMLVIFAVLTILIFFFMLFKFFNGQKAPEKKADKPVAPVVQPVAQPVQEVAYDEEVVAAITAAITCVLSAEAKSGEPTPFVIKKIRHI